MSGQDQPDGPDWWLASDGKWYPPSQQPSQQPGTRVATVEDGSFFSRLFDMSMTTFIAPSMAKVLFILGIIFATMQAVAIFAALAAAGDGAVVLGLILAPLAWFFMVIVTRVYVELMVVFFRIERNTRKN